MSNENCLRDAGTLKEMLICNGIAHKKRFTLDLKG